MHKTALFDRMIARFHDVVTGRMDVSITVRMETHSRRRSSLWGFGYDILGRSTDAALIIFTLRASTGVSEDSLRTLVNSAG